MPISTYLYKWLTMQLNKYNYGTWIFSPKIVVISSLLNDNRFTSSSLAFTVAPLTQLPKRAYSPKESP